MPRRRGSWCIVESVSSCRRNLRCTARQEYLPSVEQAVGCRIPARLSSLDHLELSMTIAIQYDLTIPRPASGYQLRRCEPV